MLHSPFHVLLKDLRTKKEKAAELLRMLPEGGPNAFDVFVDGLRLTGQSHIGYELLKQDCVARVEERKAARVEERKAARVLFPIVQYFCN